MPGYASNFHDERHRFADLKDVLAKAPHSRSDDELAGLAAETDAQRVVARSVLADLSNHPTRPVRHRRVNDRWITAWMRRRRDRSLRANRRCPRRALPCG
jgi:hypothetical protein